MAPKRRNEQEVCSRPEPFSWRGIYDGSNNLIYEAWAVPGASTADPVWLIAKYTYDGNNNQTKTEWAGMPAADYTQIQDNYLSLTYV